MPIKFFVANRWIMSVKNLVVFGLGQRGNIYATFAKTYPDKFNLVAII